MKKFQDVIGNCTYSPKVVHMSFHGCGGEAPGSAPPPLVHSGRDEKAAKPFRGPEDHSGPLFDPKRLLPQGVRGFVRGSRRRHPEDLPRKNASSPQSVHRVVHRLFSSLPKAARKRRGGASRRGPHTAPRGRLSFFFRTALARPPAPDAPAAAPSPPHMSDDKPPRRSAALTGTLLQTNFSTSAAT